MTTVWLVKALLSDDSLPGDYAQSFVVVAGSLREALDLVEAYRDPDPECHIESVESIKQIEHAYVTLDSKGTVIT